MLRRPLLTVLLAAASCDRPDGYAKSSAREVEPTFDAIALSLKTSPQRWQELAERCLHGVSVNGEKVGALTVQGGSIESRSYYGPWIHLRLYEGGMPPSPVVLFLVLVPEKDAAVIEKCRADSAESGTNRYRHVIDGWWLLRL